MSDTNFKLVRKQDPRLSLNDPSYMVIEEGSRIVNQYSYHATGASNSGLQFDNINPGSTGFVVGRELLVKTVIDPPVIPLDLVSVDNNPDTIPAAALMDTIDTAIGNIVKGVSPKQFPLARVCDNVELILNGQTFSENLSSYLAPVMAYDNPKYGSPKDTYGLTPYMRDTADYLKFETSGVIDDDCITDNVSPFKAYGFNQAIDTRTSFWHCINATQVGLLWRPVVAPAQQGDPLIANDVFPAGNNLVAGGGAGSVARVIYSRAGDDITLHRIEFTHPLTVVEPIILPILSNGKDIYDRGFTGINEIRLNLAFNNRLGQNMFGVVSDGALLDVGPANNQFRIGIQLGTLTVNINPQNSAHVLYYDVLTPKLTTTIPASNVYDDRRLKVMSQQLSGGNLNVGATSTFNSNNFSLGTVPSRLYFWLQKKRTSKTSFDADIYLTIKKIQLTFNNNNNQFGNTEQAQLYRMCKYNGLELSWLEFSKYVGSPMCLDFSRDVSLDETSYPGSIGNYQFQIQIEYENTAYSNPINQDDFEFIALSVEKGYCVIQNQICSRVTGLAQVNPSSVEISHMDRLAMYDFGAKDLYGAGIKDSIKSAVQKAASLGHKGLEWASDHKDELMNLGAKGFQLAKWMLPIIASAGMSESDAKEIIAKYGVDGGMARIVKKSKSGGGLVGGKLTGKKQMKNKLSLY